MNKEFIPYEQALELKQLGFDEKCMGHYWEGLFYYETTHSHPSTMPNSIESCLAPLYKQAFRWFREKHKIHAVVQITIESQWYFSIYNLAAKRNAEIEDTIDYKERFITYEQAELACLKKLIEIVKNK